MSYNPKLLKQLFPVFDAHLHKPTLMKGLTNQNLLFKINNKEVLYKVLNQDFNQFIDRKFERDIMFKVEKHPKIIYADDFTIVREFLSSYEAMAVEDFNSETIDKFTVELSRLHNTACATKKGKIHKIMESADFFDETKQFLNDYKHLVTDNDMKLYLNILDRFETDRSVFSKFLKNDEDKVVNCHNDINMENILLDKRTDDLIIIDYDYAQPNVLYYEFGNIFTEMNFEYTKNSPFFVYVPDNETIVSKRQMIVSSYVVQSSSNNFRDFLEKCQQYKIFSHLFWINVSFKSIHLGIDLVIPEYVRKRYELYEKEFDTYFI